METRASLELGADRLRRWLEEGQPVEVVDIRPASDYEAWHIPGSRNIDAYQAIHDNSPGLLAGYKAPPDKPVVLVCFTGHTSQTAAGYLRSRGIQALSLEGGMRRWSLAWNTAEVPLPGSPAGLVQVRRTGKGCLSYLIGSQGRALVIDPSVEPKVYLALAEERGWRITQVLDTHIHADHLSRARLLVQETQAEYLLPRQNRVHFKYSALDDGDVIWVGEATLKTIAAPGHTYESMAFYLEGLTLFSVDTLFVDGIGRPDLNATPEERRARAHLLYLSLQKLKSLDPQALVLPCHSAQPVPFDRVPISAPLKSVLLTVPAIHYDEETFIGWMIGRMPPTPEHYEEIVSLNETGYLPDGDLARLEAGANRCAA